jgi:hypothetical protein
MVQEVAATVEVALPTPTEAAEVATPAEGAVPEATSEPVETPTATAKFGVSDDPYEVIEHEDFKPLLERRDNRIRDTIRSELDNEFQEKTRKWESTQSYSTMASLSGRLIQTIEDGNIQGAERVIDRLNEIMAPHATEQIREYQSQGLAEAANQFASLLSTQLKGMDNRTQDDFDDLKRSGASWDKILQGFVKAHTEKLETRYKNQLKEKDVQIEQLKLGVRTDGPNGAAMASGSGASGKLYSQMTREERQNLSPEARDAAIQHEINVGG